MAAILVNLTATTPECIGVKSKGLVGSVEIGISIATWVLLCGK